MLLVREYRLYFMRAIVIDKERYLDLFSDEQCFIGETMY